jgi:hypothetical protein
MTASTAFSAARRWRWRWNILQSIRMLFQRLWDLGFDAVNWLWRYFLLGAVIVIPIWLLSRLFGNKR